MNSARILIVENDPLAAANLKQRVETHGYVVVGVVRTGRQAIAFVEDAAVDLLLINTVLDEDINGITAAGAIWARHTIPFVYTTAHPDSLVHRSKEFEPYGYLNMPIPDTELLTTIEIALFRSAVERKSQERERKFLTILNSIASGVVALDSQRYITFLNPIAELLMGWKSEDAHGARIDGILKTAQPEKSREVHECISMVLRDGGMLTILDVPLQSQNNTHTFIDVSIAPIRGDRRKIEGAVLAFRDASERHRSQGNVFTDVSEHINESSLLSQTTSTNGVAHSGVRQQGEDGNRVRVPIPASPIPMQNDAMGAYLNHREPQPQKENEATKLKEPDDDQR